MPRTPIVIVLCAQIVLCDSMRPSGMKELKDIRQWLVVEETLDNVSPIPTPMSGKLLGTLLMYLNRLAV